MAEILSPSLLKAFSEYVVTHLGLNFPPDRWQDLERHLAGAAQDLGYPDAATCARALMATNLTRPQAEVLASHLTIGETYFLREERTLDAIQREVLQPAVERGRATGRALRIWSAGCSTGEEPYSLAILLHQLLLESPGLSAAILATDINPRALQKASEATYTEWSFRGTPSWVKEKYFVEAGNGRFELIQEIRHMVSFAFLNLAEDSYPSVVNNTNAMDLILCRNVLMYFTPDVAAGVIERFHRALVPGGWMCLSPCDATHIRKPMFDLKRVHGVILHQKSAAPAQNGNAAVAPRKPLRRRPPLPSPVTTSTSSSAQLRRKPASNLRQSAERLFERGEYNHAAEQLKLHLNTHPRDGAALVLMARTCANRGQLSEALDFCDKAIALNKLDLSAHFLRAAVLQEQGMFEEAVGALNRVLYLDPNYLLGHFALGNLFHQQAKHPEAHVHFARALELLQHRPPGEILPDTEGISAGRLREIIESTLLSEAHA